MEGTPEHVPLNQQMLATGLPQLLAKLTQLDGIDAIVSFNPYHGVMSVSKQDLIAPLGPITRRNPSIQEYVYSNPIINVVNGVDHNRNVQQQPMSDDDRKKSNFVNSR